LGPGLALGFNAFYFLLLYYAFLLVGNLPFYLVEFSYKYNNRNKKNTFNQTIKNAIIEDKCTVKYKPKKNVKRIVYRPKLKKTMAKKGSDN
jgi:hypothetical protein